MALLHIGNAVSFGAPKDWRHSPDDRMAKVETMGGNVVQDYGVVDSGETITVSATFKKPEFEKLKAIWKNRTIVSVTDEAGEIWQNMRVKITAWSYVEMFPDTINAELEIWRV